MKGYPNPDIAPKVQSQDGAAGANTAAVVTIAAVAGERHCLCLVAGGYTATPAAAESLTIVGTIGGASKTMTYPIIAGGAFSEKFERPIVYDVNTAVTITLTAEATATGYLHAVYL